MQMTTYIMILMLNIGSPGFSTTTAEFKGEDACIKAAEAVIRKMPFSQNNYVCASKIGVE